MFRKVLHITYLSMFLAVSLMSTQLCTPVHADNSEPECWAVVIGVSEYPSFACFSNGSGGLLCGDNPGYIDNSARELARQLGSSWGEDHVRLLLNGDATKADIYYAIKWLASKADADDTVLLYFSGRGREPNKIGEIPYREYSQAVGSGYLSPFDSRPPRSRHYNLPAISLACQFDNRPSHCNQDLACCFGNPQSRCQYETSSFDMTDWYDNGSAHFHYEISSIDLARWLDKLDSRGVVIILDTSFAGSFSAELIHDDRVVLMSCAPEESSLMSRELQSSVFTYYILQALNNFDAADANHDYELSAEEIFGYAEPRTTNETTVYDDIIVSGQEKQHPVLSDCYSGELGLFMKVIFDTDARFSPDTTVLTIDEEPYSAGELPASFTMAGGSIHTFDVPPQVDAGEGTRLVFTSWDDGNNSVSRTISSGGVYTANYKTQYRLTLESAYGSTEGQSWYDAGSNAVISVAPAEGKIVRQVFTGWSGGFTGTEATALVTMDAPKVITANWRADYLRLYILVAVIVALVGATVAIHIIRKQRAA